MCDFICVCVRDYFCASYDDGASAFNTHRIFCCFVGSGCSVCVGKTRPETIRLYRQRKTREARTRCVCRLFPVSSSVLYVVCTNRMVSTKRIGYLCVCIVGWIESVFVFVCECIYDLAKKMKTVLSRAAELSGLCLGQCCRNDNAYIAEVTFKDYLFDLFCNLFKTHFYFIQNDLLHNKS